MINIIGVENDKLGHRSRFIEKFLNNSNNFSKIDLVELLLFLSIPRRDTRPLAKKIIHKFNNNLMRFFNASKEELKSIHGLGDKSIFLIKILYKFTVEIAREKIEKKPIADSFMDLVEYCKLCMSNKYNEELRVIFLNSKNHIIKDEVIFTGSINSVVAHPREIIKRCLDLGATAMILCHNHPSGDPSPSSEDIEMTKLIYSLAKKMDIMLVDHIIIGSQDFISFKYNSIEPFSN